MLPVTQGYVISSQVASGGDINPEGELPLTHNLPVQIYNVLSVEEQKDNIPELIGSSTLTVAGYQATIKVKTEVDVIASVDLQISTGLLPVETTNQLTTTSSKIRVKFTSALSEDRTIRIELPVETASIIYIHPDGWVREQGVVHWTYELAPGMSFFDVEIVRKD